MHRVITRRRDVIKSSQRMAREEKRIVFGVRQLNKKIKKDLLRLEICKCQVGAVGRAFTNKIKFSTTVPNEK